MVKTAELGVRFLYYAGSVRRKTGRSIAYAAHPSQNVLYFKASQSRGFMGLYGACSEDEGERCNYPVNHRLNALSV